MNEQEIKKELEQLPNEWQLAFVARIELRALEELPHIKKHKDFFNLLKSNILFESVCAGVFIGQYNKFVREKEFSML